MAGSSYPTRVLVNVLEGNFLRGSSEIEAEQGKSAWLGPQRDIRVGKKEHLFVEVSSRILTNVFVQPGMQGMLTFCDGKTVVVKESMFSGRSIPIPFSLLNLKSAFLSYEGRDIAMAFLRPGDTIEAGGQASLPFRPTIPDSEPPRTLAVYAWENADDTFENDSVSAWQRWEDFDAEITAEAQPVPKGKPFRIGPGSKYPVPELSLAENLVIQRSGDPPAIRFQDKEGWRCWVKEPRDDVPLDFRALVAQGRATPPACGVFEVPLSSRSRAVVRVGSCLFLLLFIPEPSA